MFSLTSRSICFHLIGFLLLVLVAYSPVHSQELPDSKNNEPVGRRIYVPVEDLDVVLERDKQGVILPREEFLKLAAEARKNIDENPRRPRNLVFSHANYTAQQLGDQLVISATIEFTQFAPGWQTVSLPFRGVSVESATLDGKPAQLGRTLVPLTNAKPQAAVAEPRTGPAANSLVLFTEAVGSHVLKLELSVNLVSVGSDRVGTFGFPFVASARLNVTLPAGKFLHVDEVPLERPADAEQAADYSVAIGGKREVSLRITDRQSAQSSSALVFATSAIGVHAAAEELTWRAVTTVQVFGRSIDGLQFTVPSTLDIVSVESTGLERWEIVDSADPAITVLKLSYRQPFEGERSITIKGVASSKLGSSWSVPTLSLSQAVSHVARVVVQHPPGLRLQVVETRGARRIGLEDIAGSEMPDMGKAAVDSTRTLHFAAWQQDFSIVLATQPKARELQTTIATRLDVTAREIIVRSSIIAQTRFAPLFDLDLTLPAEWTITEVLASGQPANWQVLPTNAGLHHVRVAFNPPIPIGGKVPLTLVANLVPTENWPLGTTPLIVKLPEVHLPEAGVTEGTYMIGADDNLEIVPQELTGLDPARVPGDQSQAANVPRLMYEYQDTRFAGSLQVARKPSRIAAHNLAFHRLDRESLSSHLESRLLITGGGTRTLQVALSESAGINLRFRLAGNVSRLVEQTPSPAANGEIIWSLLLDEVVHGNVGLSVDLEIPRIAGGQVTALPMMRVVDAEREEGHVAIEAGTDQYLTITATAAAGSTLPEIDPADIPRPMEYVPRERIVAAYHTVRSGAQVQLAESRFDRIAVPTAVGDRLDMTSILGESTGLQHRAQLSFRAVGVQSLRIELPKQATLWASLLDGQPLEARRLSEDTGAYAVPLPPLESPESARKLQLFYRTPHAPLGTSGKFVEELPAIAAINGQGETQPLEILSRHWTLHHPPKTDIVAAEGLFEPLHKPYGAGFFGWLQRNFSIGTRDELLEKTFALLVVAAVLSLLAFGYRRKRLVGLALVLGGSLLFAAIAFLMFMPSVQSARSVAGRKLASEWSALPSAESEEWHDRMSRPWGGVESATPNAPASPPAAAQPATAERSPPAEEKSEAAAKAAEGPMTADDSRARSQAEFSRSQAFGIQPTAPPDRGGELVAQAMPVDAVQLAQPEAPKADAGGLLSLSIELDPPAGSRTTEFEYTGSASSSDGVELAINYQDRHAFSFVELMLQCGMVLVFWFSRRSPMRVRAALGTLGLAIPAALVPLVPISALSWLDGLFLGGVWGLLLWLALAIGSRLAKTRFHTASNPVTTAILLAVILSAASNTTMSQEPKAASSTGKPAVNSAPNEKTPSAIVIPYDVGEEPLRAGRVFIPHDKFLELWNAAHPEKQRHPPAPVEGLVAEALYDAKVIRDEKTRQARVEITARLVLHSFRDEQITLPLQLQSVALSSAQLDGQAAAIISRDVGGKPELAGVISKRGTHVLDLRFSLPLEQNGPAGKFTLPAKPVPAGLLRLTLPANDLSVQVNGTSTAFRQIKQGDESIVLVPLGESGELSVSWRPAQSRDIAQGTVHVEAETSVMLEETGLHLSSGFVLNVRQGSVSEVTFKLPSGVLVRKISGLDLGGWEVAGQGDGQTLKVFLRRPVSDSTTLLFDLFLPQKFTDTSTSVAVPDFAPQGVIRETGIIAVFSEPQLNVTIGSTSGVSQIDAGQFSPAVSITRPQTPPLFAYRYVSRPIQLPLLVSRRKPQSQGTAEHGVLIAPRKARISSRLELTLTGAPRSEIIVQLPPGYLLYELQSPAVADYYVESSPADGAAQPTTLHVELTEPTTGTMELILDGVIPRDPDSATAGISLPVPLDMDELRSTAAVWLDRALHGNLQDFSNWKSIDPDQLPARVRQLRNLPVQFAFSSTAPRPTAISLSLSRAAPRLTADSLTALVVGESAVQYVLSLQWNISVGDESRFAFSTPDWLEGRLDFSGNKSGPRIRQISSEKIAGNRLRWTLTLDEPQRERYFVTATAVLPSPTERVDAPSIICDQARPAQTGVQYVPLETQRHYLMLVNQSPHQLDPTSPDAMESLPADDLPIKLSPQLVDQAAMIARVRDPNAAVSWQMRSLTQLRSLRASVNLMELTLVVSRDGTWRGQADFRILNRARQFLPLVMPQESHVLSLYVAGRPSRPVTTRRGERDVLLVPLPKTAEGDLSAEVRLVFSGWLAQPLPRGVRLFRNNVDLPSLRVLSPAEDASFGIEVARTSWTVHLPDDIDAAPVDDPERTNVTQSVAGYDRLVAEMNEALQLFNTANDLSGRNDAVSNYRRYQAKNNLKQLGMALQNYDSLQVESKSGKLDEKKSKELTELNTKLQVAQQQADGIQIELSYPAPRDSDGRGYIPLFSFIESDLQKFNYDGKDVNGVIARDADEVFQFKQEAKPASPAAKEQSAAKKAVDAPVAGKPQVSNRAELRNQAATQALELNTLVQPQQKVGDRDDLVQLERQSRTLATPQSGLGRATVDYSDYGFAVGQVGGGGFGGGLGGAMGAAEMTPAWTAPGGLSLAIDIPRGGQVFTFSKIGGDAKLALGLRPHVSYEMGMGGIWTLVGLSLGLVLVRALSQPGAGSAMKQWLPYALLAVGCVWYFTLPAAIVGFLLMLAGGIIQAWRVSVRPVV